MAEHSSTNGTTVEVSTPTQHGGDSEHSIKKQQTEKEQNGNIKQLQELYVYTVDDAIEKMGFGPFQLMILLFCGLLWTADAMELMILSVLSPAVKCQWDLSSAEEAIITSVVFVGALLGSLWWGILGDHLGRKTTLFFSSVFVVVSGVLSALKLTPDDARLPGYPWMLICRFGVGFGVTGVSQAAPYFIEFLPRRLRAVCSVFLSSWWALGTMFGAALAVGVMRPGGLGWHWYLGLCSVPVTVSLLFFPFIPESARFYVAHGKKAKAEKVLKKIAWLNFKSLPEGRFVLNEEKYISEEPKTDILYDECESTFIEDSERNVLETNIEKSPLLLSSDTNDLSGSKTSSKIILMLKSFSLLFTNGMWKVTLILSFLWFGSAWLYYGSVLLTSTILQENPHCEGVDFNTTLISETTAVNETCEQLLDTGDYLRIMWTAGAELPGLLAMLIIIEFVGRKLTMAFSCAVACTGFCLLFLCVSETVLTFFLFVIRAFTTGVLQTLYVYTPEVYPTKVRGFGLGTLCSVARVGSILTPYVAQVLFRTSDYATITIYAGSSLVMIVLALLLPIETKGKTLRDE